MFCYIQGLAGSSKALRIFLLWRTGCAGKQQRKRQKYGQIILQTLLMNLVLEAGFVHPFGQFVTQAFHAVAH